MFAGFIFWAVALAVFAYSYKPDQGIVLGTSIVTPVFAAEPESLLPAETYYGSPVLTDIKAMIADRQIALNPEDEVRYFPDPELGIGSTIKVYRATPIKVIDAAKPTNFRTFKKTVREFLDEKNIEVGDKDKLSPGFDTSLKPDMTIEIIRVTVTQVTTNESIDFKTVTKEDATVNKGIRNVTQPGKKGNRKKVFEVTRENGKEVSRKKLSEEVTAGPVDEIVVIGTKEVVLGQGTATWYTFPPHAPGTAAHNSLKRGTQVRVTSLSSGKSVVVKVIGGGIQGSGEIDLHPDDFKQLAPLGAGVIAVKLTQE
ncbi:G5 domain-containing protein [Candidatus Berkelbacteria bacterium]|nr:G5 domain-containing protein [Candidatus Berkelbacteria bacterium]